MMGEKRYLIILPLSIFVLFPIFNIHAAQPIELKLASYHPATGVSVADVLVPWAKIVEKRTGGKLKFTIYPGKSLLPPKEAYDGAISGIADISHGGLPHFPGRFLLSNGISLPFLGLMSATQASKVLWKIYETFPEVQNEWREVHVLWLFAHTPFQLHTRRPIRKIADMKGMKIRMPGVYGPYVKALGATPVTMPGSEVYPALEKGVVDGTGHDFQAFHSYREGEVTKYTTMMNLNTGGFFVVMAKDSYNKLPPGVRKVIDESSGEWAAVRLHAAAWDKREKEFFEEAKAIPNREIIYLPETELKKAHEMCLPLWNKWVKKAQDKGLPGQKILDEMLRLKDQYK
jgi:TRAP-type C4-dicarboxylate transport system substrate-binding protein